MTIRKIGGVLAYAVLVLLPAAAHGQSSTLSNTIIALERNAMDHWLKGDPSVYFDLLADDATLFDPRLDARMDGRAAAAAFFKPQAGVSIPRFELVMPRVQSLGDAAILTYNLVTYDANGSVTSRWNFSEVYEQSGGRWRIAHAHASFVHGMPPPAK